MEKLVGKLGGEGGTAFAPENWLQVYYPWNVHSDELPRYTWQKSHGSFKAVWISANGRAVCLLRLGGQKWMDHGSYLECVLGLSQR